MNEPDLDPVRILIQKSGTRSNSDVDGGGYIYSELYEDDIKAARQNKGVVIEELFPRTYRETPGTKVPNEKWDTLTRVSSLLNIETQLESSYEQQKYYTLQLIGPMLNEWRELLGRKGVEPLQHFPTYAYLVKISDEQFNALFNLDMVSNVQEFGYYDKGIFLTDQTLFDISDLRPENIDNPYFKKSVLLDFVLQPATNPIGISRWLASRNVEILFNGPRQIRVHLKGQLPLILEALRKPEIQVIEEPTKPTSFGLTPDAVSALEDNGLVSFQLRGKDQVIGVADVSIDTTHHAIKDRILAVDYRCGKDANLDSDGHGTHVSGIILGSYCGIAHDAHLYFQSLRKSNTEPFAGVPYPLGELFEEAYSKNVRIHNNSWGSLSPKVPYPINAMELDSFVRLHPDMLIVAAAGNSGKKNPIEFNPSSLSDLAIAKNALTVGAIKTMNGDRSLWAKSSVGPCLDNERRIKPDVLAPGVDILGPKSVDCTKCENAFTSEQDVRYTSLSGTSQAAAIVSGCAAIVRQYYSEQKHHLPSGALIKGTIINGSNFLIWDIEKAARTNDPNFALSDEYEHPPNYFQGFGYISLQSSIPNDSDPNLGLEFIDSYDQQDLLFTMRQDNSSEMRKFRIKVNGGKWLRVCLTWFDSPNSNLQNILALMVANEDRSKKWIGNKGFIGTGDPDDVFDNNNNVQIVRVDQPVPGEYSIKIFGRQVIAPPQDYALVVTGSLGSNLVLSDPNY
ncbi:MAG TPA: S8 family serine peptidase [Nitrososphaeraceae archaeon]|jgi:subtilisin family serine protease